MMCGYAGFFVMIAVGKTDHQGNAAEWLKRWEIKYP
jgi:hypothetical protein